MSATRFIVTLLLSSFAGMMLIWAQSPSAVGEPAMILRAVMQGVGISLALFYISIYLRTRRCGKRHDHARGPEQHTTAPRQRRDRDV